MMKNFTRSLFLLFILSLFSQEIVAQTMMPLPNYSSAFTGNTRGYWFTAPCDFTITGLRVPTNASTAAQYIAVLDFGTTSGPPSWSATTNAFSVLANIQGATGSGIVNVNIAIQQGHHIGFLASRGNVNAYSVVGNYTSNIDGNSVTLVRMGMQYALNAPTYPQDVWQESGYALSLVEMYYTVGEPILISSATTIQPDTTAVPAGTSNKKIIGIKINTTGDTAFAKVTEFKFDTAGAFNYSNITGPAKVYYTGNSDTFSTANLFDSTASKPTSAFTVTGSQVLDTGTVYFWLAFDVDFNATANDYLDAKCTQIKWDSGGTSVAITPVVTSPNGKIRITPPLKKLSSISFVQPSVDYVFRYSTNNPVLRIDLNVIGTASTLPLNQLIVAANNTNNSDVSDVKLYFTTTPAFSTTNMIGTATSLSGGTANFTSLNYSLPTGASYIWVTYDIPGTATIFDTVDAKIPINGINIGGIEYPASEQNPAGGRIIFTNFQYDAGISSVLSPSAPFCKTTQAIKVRLYNYGTTTLISDTIRWTVNGVAQTPYIWTGSLQTGNYTDLTIGNFTFTMGTSYAIKVFTSLINGVYTDGYHLNDT
ncbi:BNR-repeat neuraminidase N-terminal domain-containing protein, partial [Bacteroidota bacterium]